MIVNLKNGGLMLLTAMAAPVFEVPEQASTRQPEEFLGQEAIASPRMMLIGSVGNSERVNHVCGYSGWLARLNQYIARKMQFF